MPEQHFARYLCFENMRDRVGPRNDKDHVVTDPSWPQIAEAIGHMDGKDRTYVILAASEESMGDELLTVGGGENGQYVCFCYEGDEYNLVDPACTDQGVIQVLIGQLSARQRRELVSLDCVLQAAATYWATGERNPALSWAVQSV